MKLGQKLREVRVKNGLTIEELADRCELTKGYISQLERNIASPSIETLENIAEVLGITLVDFFKQDKKRKFVFSVDDRYLLEEQNFQIEWLVPNSQANELEPILITLIPGARSKIIEPFEGQIFGYVLTGTVFVYNGTNKQKAQQGDSFYLYANSQHFLENLTSNDATVLWVTSPPNF